MNNHNSMYHFGVKKNPFIALEELMDKTKTFFALIY